jgi:ribonuclease D
VEGLAYELITNDNYARLAIAELAGQTLIGLDTETFWNPTLNRSSVSLVQIAVSNDPVLVFDTLSVDFNILRPIVESPSVRMAAHNARFDEGMLQIEGLQPAHFVDTLRMARLALRLPSYSLASVTRHLFNIELDKSFQKSNWRRRPLSPSQLHYAALDARVTLMLYEKLHEMLTEQGTLDLAMRAALIGPTLSRSRGKRTPSLPLRELTPEEREVVLALKKWRLEKSFKMRIPAYRVCPDKTLEQLVIEKPRKLEDLECIHGLGPARIADIGQKLLAILWDTGMIKDDAGSE